MCTKKRPSLIDTNPVVRASSVAGNLKPRRLRQIPGVYYSNIEQIVPYSERQMAQLTISSQQPGDSTSTSTFRHAAKY